MFLVFVSKVPRQLPQGADSDGMRYKVDKWIGLGEIFQQSLFDEHHPDFSGSDFWRRFAGEAHDITSGGDRSIRIQL
jgi:hypothetical protein